MSIRHRDMDPSNPCLGAMRPYGDVRYWWGRMPRRFCTRCGAVVEGRPLHRSSPIPTQDQPMTDDKTTIFRALAAPFADSDVKTRKLAGKTVSYITARTVMNRLDEVLGPDGWWDHYQPLEDSVVCELTLRLPDGTTITKSDAGARAGMADAGDDDKSAFSDAFKRAAVKFGVGRYLYGEGSPAYGGTEAAPADRGEQSPSVVESPRPRRKSRSIDSVDQLDKPLRKIQPAVPRTGRELDEWIKQCKIDPALLIWIKREIMHPRRWPGHLPYWSEQQVAEALPLIGNHLREVRARQASPQLPVASSQ